MTVPEEMAAEAAIRKTERETLRGVIQQWNANRLDLFELSEPNEDLEFHGVMRFYFQDSGQKVATKCIRVASDATSQAVIETLIEKFRPDMRMLSVPEYALYEIHENGEERKLGLEEKPLLVQLNWHVDDREGRFLLRRIDDKTNAQGVGFGDGTSFRRKLSKREMKQIKKQEKLSRLKSATEQDENTVPVDQNGVAEKLYNELPETSFTRSISNPEAVMRRRRQQKLERKLQQFRSKDGGPDTGGTLKIYGEALCKDVPYKTLLLSVRDSAVQVVREMLSKYNVQDDPQQYCLVQVNGEYASSNSQQEYILDDDECPLAILMNHPSTRGSIMFHVRRRPADYVPRKRKKKPSGKWNEFDHRYEDERLPFFLELNPDGTDIASGAGVRHRLKPNHVTDVGSNIPIDPNAPTQSIILTGPTVMPKHCIIAYNDNTVTLTPSSRDAHTYVNNQMIHHTTILQNGAIVKFGRMHTFRFIDPIPEDRIRQRHDSNRQLDYAYDRRSPDATSQEVSSEKYRSGSGTPNGGPGSNPPSPTKSAATSPRSPTHNAHSLETTHNYETTFDLDGNVETASLTSSRDGNRLSQHDRQPRGNDPILPAVLEFLEQSEDTFLHAVITDVEPNSPQFKLAPTYTLYLAARYRASTHYRPELQPTERAHRLTAMLERVATMIQQVIQDRYMNALSLALWLANGSELLHMLKSDRHITSFSIRAQEILGEAVHFAFASLVRCVSLELAPAMVQFMADADEPAKEAGVLQTFHNTMDLLRRCRVNAALTIQLFSHLFHTINATAFNALVSNGNLCVRWFGRRLKARLNALETWAERQGLELASQCHLATIMQATHLLQAPKYNAAELATLSSTCFKLNSLQVRALLQRYQPAPDEPRLPAELIENVVKVTEGVADTLARADGREIRLEEETTLALALLLPEDGYSCEIIRGVPPGLAEFLAPLQRDGLCRMAPQPTSSGFWTIYMIDHHNNFRSPSAMSNRSGGYPHIGQSQGQPEVQVIKLHKSSNGMGLSIVAAKGAGQDRLGIYIKSVVPGGAADTDGRLTAGDQLLKVDGQSLVGITQEKAAEYLVRTGPIVTLEVAKQGAIYHGLATLLSQPSPVMTREHNKARPKSEHLEPSRLADKASQPSTSHSMGNLLSVPKQIGYQERLVDWDVDRVQPGATHLQVSQSQYPNLYHQTTPTYHNSSYHNPNIAFPRTMSNLVHQSSNSSGLAIYPINESPLGEDYHLRPRTYWTKRPIPVIQEPNQMFLSIPSHCEPYPLYPSRSSRVESSSANPQYGYYTDDKTELIFPTRNRSASFDSFDDDEEEEEEEEEEIEVFNETIPFIDDDKPERDQATQTQKFSPPEPTDLSSRGPNSFANCAKVIKGKEESLALKYIDISKKDPCSCRLSENETQKDNEDTLVISTPKMHTIMPELNLDLSGLNSELSSDDSNTEKCWKSPEEVRLGCGRVAALAKHFSKLGEAGLIKFKSMKLNGSRQFMSEPDIASPRSPEERKHKRKVRKEFRSESDLSKLEESFAPPEKEWSMILLDIQAGNDVHFSPDLISRDETDEEMVVECEENNLKSKLSLKEQQEIIEQLKEFSNLDNADAPLFIPEDKICNRRNSNSDKETMTNLENPKYTVVGTMRLENFRKNSLPSILSTLNISPGVEMTNKINRLEKYWSLKDLMAGDLESNNSVQNSPKYFIFPTSSRVVSAPEISKDDINVFQFQTVNSVNPEGGNLTIHSTISISEEESKNEHSDSESESGKARKVSFNIESTQRKFPFSFVRTRKLSKSHEELSKRKIGPSLAKRPICKSLEKLADSRLSVKSKSSLGPRPERNSFIGTHAAIKSVLQNACKSDYDSPNDEGKKDLVIGKKTKSDLNVSKRKPTPRFERGDWIFREFPPLENLSETRPRRMSERDLPSRLGHDPHPQQIHSSKSVPALHNVGTEGKQQHEVFGPGYSRASSSNSVTPPVQPPPMPAMNGATSLRSRSSHNLHDPMRASALPPSGLVARQQSSPNLNPNQMHPQNNLQGNEAERFYQNLSVYRTQDPTMKQQPSPPQPLDERNSLHAQKSLRGSQSSLNRPAVDINQGRDRPISAYIPQGQQQAYGVNQMQHQGPPPRSQSSRDIIRQEAKLQEMQEEVRRRELRGGPPITNQYRPSAYNVRPMTSAQAANSIRQSRPAGSTPNLGPTSPTYSARQLPPGYGYTEPQYNQNQFVKQLPNQYGMIPKGKSEMTRGQGDSREFVQDPPRQDPPRQDLPRQDLPRQDLPRQDLPRQDPNRHFMEQRQYGHPQNGGPYSNGPTELRNDQYSGEGGRIQNGGEGANLGTEILPSRPMLPEDSYRESPPPPPPNTSTHPLYSKQPDEQARRREAARQWRDQQIAELSSLPHRTAQQEEQLRALQLERDFQKRAEEAANQQDDDEESNDIDNESVQRIQGLLRTAAAQDRTNQANQQQNLSRTNANNQSIRGALSPQPVASQIQSTNVPLQTAITVQGLANSGNTYGSQNETLSVHNQNQNLNLNLNLNNQALSPSYGPALGQLGTSQKPGVIANPNDERERQQRIEEMKRRQLEFDESHRKREEEIRQQQQQLQMHQQQMHLFHQQQANLRREQGLHPGMLRLENLVINGPNSPSSQNGANEAPPPPERGSSYAVMSQQSALRSNTSTTSNTPIGSHQTTTKRVSFHDPNENTETTTRNTTGTTSNSSITMDTIREDPNVSLKSS
ncbi:afadin-like [Belonocnema kinseyi]|uniref:afadin-like n=1 Tax=Belonocnema kinseyi TaxID=2817044 RepID=UPI00143DC265|nr:afadin-like [Belonocnema kinseyi]